MEHDIKSEGVKSRFEAAKAAVDTLGARPAEEAMDDVPALVDEGVLPEWVLDRKYPSDDVRTIVRGFKESIERVEESRYYDRSLIEELLKVEFDLTEQIRDIDHSGRGSGCCQSEAGLKVRREAVRWILFGHWKIAK